MSRVASEAAFVQSRHHASQSHAPAAGERPPASPFASLLDVGTAASSRDKPEAPASPSRKAARPASDETRPNPSKDQTASTNDAPSESSAPQPSAPGVEAKPDDNSQDGEKAAEAATVDAALAAAQTADAPVQQQPVVCAIPDVAPVTAPPANPAPQEESTAAPQGAELAAAVTVTATTTATAETGTGDQAAAAAVATATNGAADHKGKTDGPRTIHAGTNAKPAPAGGDGETHEGKFAQALSESDDKPAPTHLRATPATAEDAPAQAQGKASGHAHAELQTTATIDAAKTAVDTAPQAANLPPNHANAMSAAAPAHTGPAPAATAATVDTAVPVAGLAVEIAARAQSGRNRFEIRLDPPELGRIDVRLDVDGGGNVTSRLVVERAETLDLLRRDAPELERALQQAGLKTGDNGLQFSLRDQSFAGRDDGRQAPAMARIVVPDTELSAIDAAQGSYGRGLRRGGGIDIHV